MRNSFSLNNLYFVIIVEDWDRPSEEPVPQPVQSTNSDEQPTKKSKKKSKLRQAISQTKPIFDPSLPTLSCSSKNSFFFVFRRKIFSTIF